MEKRKVGGHDQQFSVPWDRRLVCGRGLWTVDTSTDWAVGAGHVQKPVVFPRKVKGAPNERAQLRGHGDGPGTFHSFQRFQRFQRCREWGAVPVSGLPFGVESLEDDGQYFRRNR